MQGSWSASTVKVVTTDKSLCLQGLLDGFRESVWKNFEHVVLHVFLSILHASVDGSMGAHLMQTIRLSLFFLAALTGLAYAGSPQHVFLISIDGLRSDLVDRAQTPYLDLLIKSGSRANTARTVRPAVTLPAHASMLSGVTPKRHGFLFNSSKPERGYLKQKTVLELSLIHI